jgi:hypothetical protein
MVMLSLGCCKKMLGTAFGCFPDRRALGLGFRLELEIGECAPTGVSVSAFDLWG